MPASFFDTNLLLYPVSTDARKAASAISLIPDGATISVRLLNEHVNLGRKKLAMNWDEIATLLAPMRLALEVLDLARAMHDHRVALARRYQLAPDDAMTVAAALNAGCETLWSQDMHDGLNVEARVTIRNPFA